MATEPTSMFTERESQLMALAWQCFEEQPKIDYTKLASLAGYSNVRSASNAWTAIRKKLTTHAGTIMGASGAEVGDSATPKTVGKPTKKRKKAAIEHVTKEEQDDEMGQSPSKKTKAVSKKGATSKAAKAKAGAEIESEDEEDAGDGATAIKDEQSEEDDLEGTENEFT